MDHVTDAVIEAEAPTLEGAFVQAALATAETALDTKKVRQAESRQITASGPDLRGLLYGWLEAVIFEIITGGFAFCAATAHIEKGDGYTARGVLYGEEISLSGHGFRVEPKAPTFHEMRIDSTEGRTLVRFLLDL